MPVARYIVWVGTSLLVLLFVANWFLPQPPPEPAHEASDKPVIRIASIQQPPDRVVIDTNQPTIVPPPPLFESAGPGSLSALQSYASVDPSPIAVDSAQKRPAIKRAEARVATYRPAQSNTPAVAHGGSPIAAQSTRLSFAEIIPGQLLRNHFQPALTSPRTTCRILARGSMRSTTPQSPRGADMA